MKRRLLISTLCLSLASLAPAPLSACALWMSLPADCAPAATTRAVSHCEEMAASAPQISENETSLQASAAGLPCCQVSAAPASDARTGDGNTKLAPAAAAVVRVPQISAAKVVERAASSADALIISPPDQQSLLCTFLI